MKLRKIICESFCYKKKEIFFQQNPNRTIARLRANVFTSRQILTMDFTPVRRTSTNHIAVNQRITLTFRRPSSPWDASSLGYRFILPLADLFALVGRRAAERIFGSSGPLLTAHAAKRAKARGTRRREKRVAHGRGFFIGILIGQPIISYAARHKFITFKLAVKTNQLPKRGPLRTIPDRGRKASQSRLDPFEYPFEYPLEERNCPQEPTE